jgi:transposase
MPPEFMDTRQVARYLKVSRHTIYRYRMGQGVLTPLPFIRLNPRKIVYDVRAVRIWLRKTMIERPNGTH